MSAVKYSRQREAIKRFLTSRRDHPTADMVYRAVRSEFPHISLGTVYRNLALLAEQGEIARLRMGDGGDRFDPDVSPHHHFICSRCGAVRDFALGQYAAAIDGLSGKRIDGSLVRGSVAYCYGICAECLGQEED